MSYTPHGLTAVDLQRELAQTLRELFADVRLQSVDPEGMRAPHVFLQELPIPQDEYDASFSELPGRSAGMIGTVTTILPVFGPVIQITPAVLSWPGHTGMPV